MHLFTSVVGSQSACSEGILSGIEVFDVFWRREEVLLLGEVDVDDGSRRRRRRGLNQLLQEEFALGDAIYYFATLSLALKFTQFSYLSK